MARYFVDVDGADEPTIFDDEDLTALGDPAVVIRRAELPGPYADLLWSVLVGALTADDATIKRVAMALHRDQCDCPSLFHPPLRVEFSYQTTARTALAALAQEVQ